MIGVGSIFIRLFTRASTDRAISTATLAYFAGIITYLTLQGFGFTKTTQHARNVQAYFSQPGALLAVTAIFSHRLGCGIIKAFGLAFVTRVLGSSLKAPVAETLLHLFPREGKYDF